MVDGGNFVVENVWIFLVQINSFFDNGLVVLVQRQAGRIHHARAFHAPRFDFQHVELSRSLAIHPSADRIASERGFDFVRPIATVSVDAAEAVNVFAQHMDRVRRDDDLQRPIGDHHARHAGGKAAHLRIAARATIGLIGKTSLVNGLVFGGQWGLLSEASGLCRIIGWLAGDASRSLGPAADPGAFPVGIFGIVERVRARHRKRHRKRRRKRQRHQNTATHVNLPFGFDGRRSCVAKSKSAIAWPKCF